MLEKEEERRNIIDILKKAKQAIAKGDVLTLKNLSSRTVHSASIYKDPDSIAIAVVIYALSKILEREKYRSYKEWPALFRVIEESIEKSIRALENKKIKEFREALSQIRKAVSSLSGHLRTYILEVFRKAQVNKASRIYEHGISASETAKLLGITRFELAEYVGRTGIADVALSITTPIKERIKFARKLFEE